MIEAFTVIIPSAGNGERFGSDIPKQYLKIGQKLVINYSLELFLNFKECKKIIIAVSNLNAIPKDLTKDSRIEIHNSSAGTWTFTTMHLDQPSI